MNEYMLTTTDNPYDPFTQWDEWFALDVALGYNTCALLDRVTRTSEELNDEDQDLAIETAMDEIVELNASGVHRKVARQ